MSVDDIGELGFGRYRRAWLWTISTLSSFFLPLSLSLALSLSLSLSLSLLFSKAGNHLKWKWKRKWFSVVLALILDQLEMLFSLTEFEVTTKHLIFRKIISGINLKSIQTQPIKLKTKKKMKFFLMWVFKKKYYNILMGWWLWLFIMLDILFYCVVYIIFMCWMLK